MECLVAHDRQGALTALWSAKNPKTSIGSICDESSLRWAALSLASLRAQYESAKSSILSANKPEVGHAVQYVMLPAAIISSLSIFSSRH